MTVRRLLALLIAVGLVVAAVLIRRAMDDDGRSDDGGARSAGATTAVCATELVSVCRTAGFGTVTPEAPGTTTDRLARGEALGADVWVVTEPWPAMVPVVADAAGRAATTSEVSRPVATTALSLVGWGERLDLLERACAGTVTWRCIGDHAGRPWTEVGGAAGWGTITVGVDPVSTTSGLLTVGGATRGYFASAEPPVDDVATNDLDTDEGFGDWLAGLARASLVRGPGSGTVLDRFVRAPSGASMVTALGADADRLLATAARADRFLLVTPEPAVTTSVVVWGARSGELLEPLRTALARAGWDAPAASGAAGLPKPGVMVQLRGRWNPPRS